MKDVSKKRSNYVILLALALILLPLVAMGLFECNKIERKRHYIRLD